MSKVLLSDEQIPYPVKDSQTIKQRAAYKHGYNDGLAAVIKYLGEPCEYIHATEPFDSNIHFIACNAYTYKHRRDCPECWKELRKEVE